LAKRRDPMGSKIESALQAGRFIGWNEEAGFVSSLEEVEREIAALTAFDPMRAVSLYEAFIAACYLKAEEIDSEWGVGNFVAGPSRGWIQARQAAGGDPEMTAKTLLSWMDRDDYGFFNELGSDAVKVLDRAGLAAFERQVRTRFELARSKREERVGNYFHDEWGKILRCIYAQQRHIEKYLDIVGRTALTQADCATIAAILQAKRKLNDALIWIDRGIEMEKADTLQTSTKCNLAGTRRSLLAKLGRGREALDSAWTEYQARPSTFTYQELLRYVPKPERRAWHEKAMGAAENGNFASVIELWLKMKESGRLAERLNFVGDGELEELGHFVTEPAAKALVRTHPAIAARLYRALCMRILIAGKSKYYYAALANLEEARRCYQAAGLDDRWRMLVSEIRRNHCRKSGFMLGFEAIVAGKRARLEPSFMERAQWRWESKTKP
jgi:hypothetical protein